jgi:uncharacterized protein (TIGR02246 family)
MRRAVALVILVAGIMTACQRAPEVNLAAEEQKVRGVMEKINAAWESEDLEVFSRLVVHDVDMVSFGADVNDRWVGWEGLERGLRQQFEVFSDTKVTPRHMDIHVSDTGKVAWLAQAMGIDTTFMGSPMTLEARITAVFEKRETGWRLVQFHYSVPMSESMRLGG